MKISFALVMKSTPVAQQASYIGRFYMLSIGLKKHCKETNAWKKSLYFLRKYYPTSVSILCLFQFNQENMKTSLFHEIREGENSKETVECSSSF